MGHNPHSNELGSLLSMLGQSVQQKVISSRDLDVDHMIVGHDGGDTIFHIDRKVEPVVIQAVENWPSNSKPVIITAEGFGSTGEHLIGGDEKPAKYKLLVDPIDGTRGLMYDKRSAWFLAAIAPNHGPSTTLCDTIAAAMVELPTSKQIYADTLIAVQGGALKAERVRTDTGEAVRFNPTPSKATNLLNSFAQVSNFFPGTKALASELMERIAQETIGSIQPGQASIFDDQYISTGGQLVELTIGHDRFCCDLRPLFYEILAKQSNCDVPRGLECHPYDLAGMYVAQTAGVVLTDGWGGRLDAPFDVSTGMHWCGYANQDLRNLIAPVIIQWLSEKLGVPAPS